MKVIDNLGGSGQDMIGFIILKSEGMIFSETRMPEFKRTSFKQFKIKIDKVT